MPTMRGAYAGVCQKALNKTRFSDEKSINYARVEKILIDWPVALSPR